MVLIVFIRALFDGKGLDLKKFYDFLAVLTSSDMALSHGTLLGDPKIFRL